MRTIALTDLPPALQRQVVKQLQRKDKTKANNVLKAFKPLIKAAANHLAKYPLPKVDKQVLAQTKPVMFTVEHMTFMRLLDVNFIHRPVHEFLFSSRRFRFDYVWESNKLALEIEGGVFTKQAHGSVTGILRDMTKYSLAASLGWRVIRVLPSKLNTSETIKLIKDALRFKVVEGV